MKFLANVLLMIIAGVLLFQAVGFWWLLGGAVIMVLAGIAKS